MIFFAAQSIKCSSGVSIEQYKKAKINEIIMAAKILWNEVLR